MKLYCTIVFLSLLYLYGNAQTVEYLNANNIEIGIGVGGVLFTEVDPNVSGGANYQMCKVPKGSNTVANFAATLWLAGYDTMPGASVCATETYGTSDTTFFDGPVIPLGAPHRYDATYDAYYKRVFKVTRSQLVAHQALPFPVQEAQVSTQMLQWPGKGNPYVMSTYGINISSPLAHFIDVDHDGIYDATKGDYPEFCGEQAIFFCFNTDRRPNNTSLNAEMTMEIRGLAEVFVDAAAPNYEKGAINNTLLVSYEIQNKVLLGGGGFSDFYVALWQDPDLGCFNNDRVGSDASRNMMFAYNNGVDPNCNGVTGYGNRKIAIGTKLLNRPVSTIGYFTNVGGPDMHDPTTCDEAGNYMRGYWLDNTHFTAGGNGHNTGTPTNFMFFSDPNDAGGWSDYTSGQQAGDRRMYASSGPMTFTGNETKRFQYAFIASYDSTATHLTIVDTLKRDADLFQQFYDQEITACRSQFVNGVESLQGPLQVSVCPNPALDLLNIQAEAPIQQIELLDVLGRTVFTKTNCGEKTAITVSAFSPGVYLVKVSSAGKEAVKKIVLNTGGF